jgi:hypothetical protein
LLKIPQNTYDDDLLKNDINYIKKNNSPSLAMLLATIGQRSCSGNNSAVDSNDAAAADRQLEGK